MKITKRQLKRIIKEEKAKLLKEQQRPDPSSLARTEKQYGRTEGGNPQSYTDLTERMQKVFLAIEGITMDYSDSGWLADGDQTSIAKNLEDLFITADRLDSTVTSLAQSMGEI